MPREEGLDELVKTLLKETLSMVDKMEPAQTCSFVELCEDSINCQRKLRKTTSPTMCLVSSSIYTLISILHFAWLIPSLVANTIENMFLNGQDDIWVFMCLLLF
jgi:hypothetical protein